MCGWRELTTGVQHILVVNQQLTERTDRGRDTPRTGKDGGNEVAAKLPGMPTWSEC